MDTLQLVIDSISKIAIIPQSISQGISPQPIACLDALHKLGVVLIALFNLIFSFYLYKTRLFFCMLIIAPIITQANLPEITIRQNYFA